MPAADASECKLYSTSAAGSAALASRCGDAFNATSVIDIVRRPYSADGETRYYGRGTGRAVRPVAVAETCEPMRERERRRKSDENLLLISYSEHTLRSTRCTQHGCFRPINSLGEGCTALR